LPPIAWGSSTVTRLLALTTVADGFARRIVSISAFTCSIDAESILLMTTTWAMRRLASPGW
jgi:hypothetical protein